LGPVLSGSQQLRKPLAHHLLYACVHFRNGAGSFNNGEAGKFRQLAVAALIGHQKRRFLTTVNSLFKPTECLFWRDVKKKNKVGNWQTAHHHAQRIFVGRAGGIGGRVIANSRAVGDDPLMGTQRWHHPFRPVPVAHERGEQVGDPRTEYVMVIRHAKIGREFREQGPDERRTLRCLQRDRQPLGGQPVSEQLGLRGLAGSVESGETDQSSLFGHRTSVSHGISLSAVTNG
jgi:hypothetical protein